MVFKDVGAVAKFIDKEVATVTTIQVLVEFLKQISALNSGEEIKVSNEGD